MEWRFAPGAATGWHTHVHEYVVVSMTTGHLIFDRACDEHGIEHLLTKVNHPWTDGQVERMNRTIKDATVRRCHCDSHDQLGTHLQLFVDAYNHARRLKTLRGLTPVEFIHQAWTKDPERFRLDPLHLTPGPHT